ncbi:uncharacterized protein [Apostichopus japonicus]|uniref:uncharacterized protein n=1 Tax=Stichopus japonicus TaxID=307972 RepID=UPI003AB23D76
MPNKKKKFNARFPPARIKKIMQTDEEVGKVAAAVPVLISKALEHFIQDLLVKASRQTLEKNAKTLTTSHIKQCIHREKVFDFLKDLVVDIPDLQNTKDNSTSSNSGQSTRQKKAGRGKKRKTKASHSNSFSDEESSENEEDGDEEEEDLYDENSSGSRTTVSPSGSQSYNSNFTEGSSSREEQTHEADQPGPSYVDLKTMNPSKSAHMNFSCPVPMGQYTPRKVSTEQTLEDDEDYDT